MAAANLQGVGHVRNMKRMVKEWVSKDPDSATYYEGMALYDMVLLKAIMNDTSILPRGELVKSQVFAGMDRVVHLREGFGFGISMFSDRISAFEFGNGENIKGWYTGMGMTNLYNNDLLQYKDHYWPTVDSYRLAGTTTDGSNKPPVAWASYYNPRKWVGGVTLENVFSTAGMDFSLTGSTGSSLEGKKSWFNFDDEIVALGSGIRGGDGRTVETIVENRKINDAGDNPLIVNGQAKGTDLGWEETMDQVSWAHLAGNVPGSDIGYYFPKSPETPSIHGMREARTGSWKEINTTHSATPRTKNYVSLAFNHGENPLDASYSYVLLPGKSVDVTEDYSRKPDNQVLSNTSKIHAVRETKLGITAVNFWEPGTMESISSDKPAAVMVKEAGGMLTVSVSDPTQSQDKVIIELNNEGKELISKDPAVEVLQLSPTIKLSISVDGAIGRTFTAKLKLHPPAVTLSAPDSVEPGKQFTVSVGLTDLPQSVISKVHAEDLTLSYDPNLFSYVSVENADECTKVVGVNQTAQGTLRILAVNEDGISTDKELLRVAFTAKDVLSVTRGAIAVTKAELGMVPDVGLLEAVPKQIMVTVITLPGDVNRDGTKDVKDLALAASYYLLEHDEAGWEQAKAADLNRNGRIDFSDLSIIAKNIFQWR